MIWRPLTLWSVIFATLSKVIVANGFLLDYNKVVFVILSQSHDRHAKILSDTKAILKEKLSKMGVPDCKVFDLQNDFKVKGGWSIIPLVPVLKTYTDDANWFVFLADNSRVHLENLSEILSRYQSDYGIFLGHALKEMDNTIYPDINAGFVMSTELIKSYWTYQVEKSFRRRFEIISQTSYHLSVDVNVMGSFLDHEPRFCNSHHQQQQTKEQETKECGIYPDLSTQCPDLSTEDRLKILKKTLFAVKTCPMYHIGRLSIVKSTWARVVRNIIYVSEEQDPSNATIVLPGGETGHCQKTHSIFPYFVRRQSASEDFKWLVIADDDTMLGVSKLVNLIGCYDNDDDNGVPVAMGERYGRYYSVYNKTGYDFQSGGGGMVYNAEAAIKIATSCPCPINARPDDIHLALCLDSLNIPIIHSEKFHQQIPEAYDPDLLDRQGSILQNIFPRYYCCYLWLDFDE